MNPLSMEKAKLKNMIEKTGKPIKEWIDIVNKQNLINNKDKVNFLKKEYSLGHFYAQLIVRKSN